MEKNEFNTNLSQDVSYADIAAAQAEDEGAWADEGGASAAEPAPAADTAPEEDVSETPATTTTDIGELKKQVTAAKQAGDGAKAYELLAQIQKLREEEAK